jgi:peptidase M50B-like protein
MAALPLEEMVQRIGEKQPPLPAASALGIGLACLLVVMFPVTWMFVRYFSTMAHEGSHGVMGSLFGWKVTGVWLRLKDANGLTKSQGGQGKNIPSLLVGYAGPSAFGLAAAKLISIGHSAAVLWLALALLLLLLAFVRNIFGIAAILVAGYVIYIFARYGTVTHETMAAYGIAWLLLLSGVRGVLMHWDKAGDAGILEGKTDIRPVVFARFWLVGTLFALFLGTRLMM